MAWRPSGRSRGRAPPGEPGDPISRSPAATIRTTTRLGIVICLGCERHVYRVVALRALAAAIGNTTDCALVASAVTAATYFNGGAASTP